jgi:hypothetical protein
MRKLCGFCFVLALGVGLGRLSSGRIQQAEAGGVGTVVCSARNGDVNSDGKVDVSDAITVVEFLFLGRPALLQPYCPPDLPPVGSTPGRFVDNGDGTVTDEATGLMWAQDAGPSQLWPDAVSYCDGLALAEHDDWRLPDIRELFSLLQFESSQYMDPAFNGNGAEYWSATADYTSLEGRRYVVDFGQAPTGGAVKWRGSAVASPQVRAVRKPE